MLPLSLFLSFLLGTPGQCVSPRFTQILRFIKKALRVTTPDCTATTGQSGILQMPLLWTVSSNPRFSGQKCTIMVNQLLQRIVNSADGPSPFIPLVMVQVLEASSRASEFFKVTRS